VAPPRWRELGVRVTAAGEEESALLLRCPAAEPAIGRWRARLDLAAGVGVPAHVTVMYPFAPVGRLSAADHTRLARLFAAVRSFALVGERTAWFGDTVLYVELTGAAAVASLTDAVTAAFPAYRPYGGAYAEVVPHLTVGDDHEDSALRTAEDAVRAHLPFTQVVTEVELWSGPPPVSRRGRWRVVRAYPLG
jgi:hypothetical protein